MDTLVLALVAAASLTATWFFCLRPMRRGRCVMSRNRDDHHLSREIAELREEIRVLRAQEVLADRQPPPVRRRLDG
ncbi:MAG: hypothetical protein ACRDRZ_15735 [Pseudonocardiaceae bacterium]